MHLINDASNHNKHLLTLQPILINLHLVILYAVALKQCQFIHDLLILYAMLLMYAV